MYVSRNVAGKLPVVLKSLCRNGQRTYATKGSRGLKVAVLGAAGQVGQPLSLMLKNSPFLDELALYDVCGTSGLCAELSQIDTKCRVYSYKGKIRKALQNAQVVVIVASAPGSAECNSAAMFKSNAVIVFDLRMLVYDATCTNPLHRKRISSCTPSFHSLYSKAQIAIVTDPVNSMVPLACEVLKKFCVYNSNSVYGVMTLDVMRANMYVAKTQGVRPEKVNVPVIGGHSDKTVIPVLSRTVPQLEFDNEDILYITEELQSSNQNPLPAKSCGSLSLSSAFAISRFVISVIRATRGESNIVECAYVRSDIYSNLKYLSTPLRLGSSGAQHNLGLPPLSDYEDCQLQNAAVALKKDIALGESFVTGKGYKPHKAVTVLQRKKISCINDLDVCNPCT